MPKADCALAQRLKELRLASGLSQQQLARAIGVSKGVISQYELGRARIPYERHAFIARALGCRQTEFYLPPGTGPQRGRPRIRIYDALDKTETQAETVPGLGLPGRRRVVRRRNYGTLLPDRVLRDMPLLTQDALRRVRARCDELLGDVCEVAGDREPRDAAARLDDDEKGVITADTPGGARLGAAQRARLNG